MATRSLHSRSADGSAYGRPPQHFDEELARVGPGTPCGELFRRYWQPIAEANKVTTRPQNVRILGEDLVLFRDRKGRAGLLYPRCMHRGTSLFYGKVEDEGIRCCYHGWLFGVDGQCLDQPCEPEHGLHGDKARQPWYPVEERYGLVFAYMGPPEKKPILPRYDILEDIGPDDTLVCGCSGAQTGDQSMPIAPYNWMHLNDNIMDPYHVWVLHSTFTGPQFASEFLLPAEKTDFFTWELGVCYSAVRRFDDGRVYDRISSFIMPSIMSVPENRQLQSGSSTRISWVVPVDDIHFTTFTAGKVKPGGSLFQVVNYAGRTWAQMTPEEHQDTPGDFEAQFGQGAISLHSEEHLATSDRGIVMMRRMLRAQIKVVAQGGDPLGVAFDPERATVKVPSGNFFRSRTAAE
jgi:nitrite reductase/ring-hydroxylating ferredoxin subunit